MQTIAVRKRDSHSLSAFTLIELSIVLVIIGLVIGGVLVGRDMIQAARALTIISEMESIVTNINTFKAKYNCLPGDCANAASLFSGAANGNGDGRIGIFYGVQTAELYQTWYHLKQAGMISGNYNGSNQYRNLLPGQGAMQSRLDASMGYTVIALTNNQSLATYEWSPSLLRSLLGHSIMFGTQQQSGCCETYGPAITPPMAYAIDGKLDDGLPGKGNIVNLLALYLPNCQTTVDPATAIYNLSVDSQSCSLTFVNRF